MAVAAVLAAASPAVAATYLGAGATIDGFTLSSITVTDDFQIGDVNVSLSGLGHNFSGDVQLYLIKDAITVACSEPRLEQLHAGDARFRRRGGDLHHRVPAQEPARRLPAVRVAHRLRRVELGRDLDAEGGRHLGGVSGAYTGWTLDLAQQVVSAVPEPATWAMIAGFGLAGFVALRSQRRDAALSPTAA